MCALHRSYKPSELQFQRAEEDKSVLVLEQSCVSPRACACARRYTRSRACLHPVQSSCCLSARLSSQNGRSQNTIGLTVASFVLLVRFVIGIQGEERKRTQTFAHSSAAEACRVKSHAKVDIFSHRARLFYKINLLFLSKVDHDSSKIMTIMYNAQKWNKQQQSIWKLVQKKSRTKIYCTLKC